MIEEQRFIAAKTKVMDTLRERHGIGTLQEKTLHAIMKHFYAPDEEMHEIPIENYVADIYTGKEIIEIQNGNYYKMRSKLEAFLPLYPVTIITPIPHKKWLIWIDEENGEMTAKRKSPVTGNTYSIFSELYRIKSFLGHENLRFCFPLIDIEEYRLLNGWSQDKKKGSHRYDRIPVAIESEVRITRREDYLQFLPYELPGEFTSKELSAAAKINQKWANLVLNILESLDVAKRVGKKGRYLLYSIDENLL